MASDDSAPLTGTPFAIEGRHFDPGSARPRAARLLVRDAEAAEHRVAVEGEGEMTRRIMEVSDRIGALERRLTFTTGDVFVTADNDAVDRLSVARGTGWTAGWGLRLADWERLHPRLLAVLLVSIAAVFFLVRDGVPLAARVAAAVTPPEAVMVLDASGRQTLDRLAFSESDLDASRQERLEANFQDLLAVADTDGLRPRLLFRDGGRLGPNALALPGGTVVLTDQLAELMSDDEVTAVLAHEIAHATERHSLRQLYRTAGIAAIVAMVLGDPGPVLDSVVGGGSILLVLQNSRALEREADLEGLELLHEAGWRPALLAEALDKLFNRVCGPGGCEETGWLDSHPGGEERRRAILDRAAELERR